MARKPGYASTYQLNSGFEIPVLGYGVSSRTENLIRSPVPDVI